MIFFLSKRKHPNDPFWISVYIDVYGVNHQIFMNNGYASIAFHPVLPGTPGALPDKFSKKFIIFKAADEGNGFSADLRT